MIIGRQCELKGEREVSELEEGMDFREARYRREVFLRFFTFHLRYRSHPGCVYFVLPELAEREKWDTEAKLWFAYLNGNTQNPITSWRIFQRFPDVRNLDMAKLKTWFDANWKKLAWDTDRRYFKSKFIKCVERYRELLGGGAQKSLFDSVAISDDEAANFRSLWQFCEHNYTYFGRLSTFSYLEYLRIMGVAVDCDNLFLRDLDGSKSHRNGLSKVLGRDDLDWHDSNPSFKGRYTDQAFEWLKKEADLLLADAKKKTPSSVRKRDVGFFTMESALCTYKSWHRPNRRYPNVYADMMVERIRWSEQAWGDRLDAFWQIRNEVLPKDLRLEDNPADPGIVPEKQNHYRETGEVIMMDVDWKCFRNRFNAEVRRKQAA